tara:strand:+ start:1995 stop:2177 length:183 start_codon:yes stop_codon:yes gene_type:complete
MKEQCKYCGGNCPNDRGDNLCDGFAGDIDGLYTDALETVSLVGSIPTPASNLIVDNQQKI